MSRVRRKEKKGEEDDIVERNVFFFYAQTLGQDSYKQIFNTRVRCNVLLDCIRDDMLQTLGSQISRNLADAKNALTNVMLQEEEKKKQDEALQLQQQQSQEADSAREVEVQDSARTEKKKQGRALRTAQTTNSRGKRAVKADATQAVEEIDPLQAEKQSILQNIKRLEHGLEILESITQVDLLDSSGNPLNLRGSPKEYAETLLRPATVYTIAFIEPQDDNTVRHISIEI